MVGFISLELVTLVLGLGAFDMGYLNVGGLGKWDTGDEPYPSFIMNNTKNGLGQVMWDISKMYL